MPTDTEIDNLVINQLTQAQYNGASINNNELYFVTDGKISADDVDDSNATNKFVTASDKTAWNAKQDEIDSNHKLSADLVDDSNTTNKFVTTSDKQTWSAKQDALVSGTNIKTVNSNSLLGSGDVTVQETLVSGTNIKTINNQSLLGSGNITISSGGTATDVQINGTSITSNNVADIITESAYNASSNKIATMSDVPTDTSDLTNGAGYITGISSADVTNALGYTPYNSSNPNGYTSNTGTVTQVNAGAGLNTTSDDSDIDGGSLTSTGTLFLTKTAVTAGTYQGITVDKYGRVTGASNQGYTTNTGTVTSVQVQAGTGLTSSTSTAQTTTLDTTIGIDSNYKLPTTTEWGNKQDTLVSGTNIKTINSESILGSGDISTAVVTNDTLSGSGTTASPLKVSANRLKRACCWKNETTIGNGTLFSYNSSTQEETTTTAGTVVFSDSSYSLTYIRDGKIYTGKVGSETQLGTDYSDWTYVVNVSAGGYTNYVGIRNGALYRIVNSTSLLIDDTKNYTDIVINNSSSTVYVCAIADGHLYNMNYSGSNSSAVPSTISTLDDANTYSKLFSLVGSSASNMFFIDSDGYLHSRNKLSGTVGSQVGTSSGWTMAYMQSTNSYTRGIGICNGVLKRTLNYNDYVLDNTETWIDCVCSFTYGYAITQSGKLYRISFTSSGATLTQIGTDIDWQKTSKTETTSEVIFIKGGKVVSVTTANTPVVTEISSANTITKIMGNATNNAYWTGAETTTTTLRYTTNYPQVNDNTYINTTGTVGATITAVTSSSINDGTLVYQRYTAGDSTFSTTPTELSTQTLTTKQLIDLLEE